MGNHMSHREYLPRRTYNGIDPEVKKLWFRRDLEPELLSGESIPDEPCESDPMHERDAKALVGTLLQLCKPQEVRVLTMRFMEEMTLQQVGDVLGVSRERIRQIEAKAMRRIRRSAVSDKNVRAFFG